MDYSNFSGPTVCQYIHSFFLRKTFWLLIIFAAFDRSTNYHAVQSGQIYIYSFHSVMCSIAFFSIMVRGTVFVRIKSLCLRSHWIECADADPNRMKIEQVNKQTVDWKCSEREHIKKEIIERMRVCVCVQKYSSSWINVVDCALQWQELF